MRPGPSDRQAALTSSEARRAVDNICQGFPRGRGMWPGPVSFFRTAAISCSTA